MNPEREAELNKIILESYNELAKEYNLPRDQIVDAVAGKGHSEALRQQEAISQILLDPNFLELIDRELDKKVVGEHEARKTIFMVTNMRNVENLNKATDNLMVNAPSGTGKDHLCEAIFDLIPEEEKEELIRTTPKVLAYTRNRKIVKGGKDD